jgi:hypothetical protein
VVVEKGHVKQMRLREDERRDQRGGKQDVCRRPHGPDDEWG